MVRVKNDGLGLFELMLKQARETFVPALSHTRRVLDRFPLFRIKMDVEMRGLEDLEVERFVLDLVSSEVLSGHRSREGSDGHGQKQRAEEDAAGGSGARRRRVRTSVKNHGTPLLPVAFASVQVTALTPGEPIHGHRCSPFERTGHRSFGHPNSIAQPRNPR